VTDPASAIKLPTPAIAESGVRKSCEVDVSRLLRSDAR
jgi:hypothetical protein